MEKKTRNLIAIAIFILMLVAGVFLFRPILMPFAWALILAAGLSPLTRWINKGLKNRSITSLIVCVLVLLFLAVPVWQFSKVLGKQSAKLIERVERLNQDLSKTPDGVAKKLNSVIRDVENYVNGKIGPFGLNFDVVKAYRTLLISVSKFFSNLPRALAGISLFILNIFFFFVILFFLIRYGREMTQYFRDLLPIEQGKITLFFTKFREITFVSILTSGVIALVQGTLGLIIYLSLGVPESFLWAVFTSMCSFVPFIGASGAWLSVTVLLLLSGAWLKAGIMFVLGIGVISLSDNFIRPFLIRGKNNIHPVLLFFSIICGVMTMGFIGVFAGPLITVLVMTALEIYRSRLAVSGPVHPDSGAK